jgi:glycosyltransferase involved in cell wall biosynthesis
MHVMVVNNLYPPLIAGGAERIVAYLCEGLAARGHRVTVVSTCGPEMEPYPNEIRNGVEIIRFFPPNIYWSAERNRGPGFRKILWHARDAWNTPAGRRFKEVLETTKPDILHTHLIDGFSASIWRVAQRFGMRVIHTAHDYHLMCPRAFMLTREWNLCEHPTLSCRAYRAWHIRTTRYMDLFVSPSRFLLEMHQRAGLQSPNCALVHNGIPIPADAKSTVRQPGAPPRFVMMTRLTVEKGIDVVLDAVRRLPEQLRFDVTIAGVGPLAEKVRAVMAQDSRISYLGFVDGAQKTEVLSRADYLLLPSLWYENAPVTIVEAAAYGLGVVGSRIGAIPEFVQDGDTGLLFPPGDSAALANVMRHVIENPDALPSLSTRARAYAAQFSAERMIDAYESHYYALLNLRPDRIAA